MKLHNKIAFSIAAILLIVISAFFLSNPQDIVSGAKESISIKNISDEKKNRFNSNVAKPENINKVNSALTLHESADEKRKRAISNALLAINSTNVEARLYGIQVLAFLDPEMAVLEIHKALLLMESQPDIEGMIILGALKLARNETHFSNEVIHNIYKNTSSDNIRGRLARILSFRGDDSVLVNYLSNIEPKLTKSGTQQKTNILLMLGSVESKLAIPYIKPYLSDSDERIRIAALTALSFSANIDELELVTPMQFDVSEYIRNNANIVVDYLTTKGKSLPLPADISTSWNENDYYTEIPIIDEE